MLGNYLHQSLCSIFACSTHIPEPRMILKGSDMYMCVYVCVCVIIIIAMAVTTGEVSSLKLHVENQADLGKISNKKVTQVRKQNLAREGWRTMHVCLTERGGPLFLKSFHQEFLSSSFFSNSHPLGKNGETVWNLSQFMSVESPTSPSRPICLCVLHTSPQRCVQHCTKHPLTVRASAALNKTWKLNPTPKVRSLAEPYRSCWKSASNHTTLVGKFKITSVLSTQHLPGGYLLW